MGGLGSSYIFFYLLLLDGVTRSTRLLDIESAVHTCLLELVSSFACGDLLVMVELISSISCPLLLVFILTLE
ncbi:MAG: hypothetical protein DRP88_04125 [Candidatus Neomarinimicrobiota bacterium]|nr:MAG: hypothetical protein DRP88_04125 [Candidatus Neomarinimicrobiota bacterium]